MPLTMSLSWPYPPAFRTVTGMMFTPAYPTPAMPTPLSAEAATMPAISVPWPLGSVVPSANGSRTEVPGSTLPARSSWEELTPVSRIATVALPAGLTVPYSWSQPMRWSDHCDVYPGSLTVALTLRTLSASTSATDESPFSAATAESEATTVCRRSGATLDTSVAPAAARADAWSASEVPAANVTR